jgi:hypothetical protein
VRRLLWPFILSLVCASGCLPRERFNKNCEWTLDASRRLDLNDPRDREHLIQDAQLAEELATRYSDFKAKQVTGYEGHGGYLEQDGSRPAAGTDCSARSNASIASHHNRLPKPADIVTGRFDLAVILSFAVFYVLATRWVCRSLARRFGHYGERVWGVAVVHRRVCRGHRSVLADRVIFGRPVGSAHEEALSDLDIPQGVLFR